jgi:hypothetical protein
MTVSSERAAPDLPSPPLPPGIRGVENYASPGGRDRCGARDKIKAAPRWTALFIGCILESVLIHGQTIPLFVGRFNDSKTVLSR